MADAEAEVYEVDSWPGIQQLPKEDVGNRQPLAPVPFQVRTNSNITLKVWPKVFEHLHSLPHESNTVIRLLVGCPLLPIAICLSSCPHFLIDMRTKERAD